MTLAGPDARVSPLVNGLHGVAPRAMLEDSSGAVWVAGGAMVDEVMKGPTASPETMKMVGYTPA